MKTISILLKRDLQYALFNHKKRFVFAILLFVACYFAFYRNYLEFDGSSAVFTSPGVQNVLIYYVKCNFPLFVSMLVLLCYTLGESISEDKHIYGIQYMLRCSKKKCWLYSKWLYALIMITIYYVLFLFVNCVLHTFLFGTQFILDKELANYFEYVEVVKFSDLELVFQIWIYPYLVEVFIGLVYISLQMFISPVLSMIACIGYCSIPMYMRVSPFVFVVSFIWSDYSILLILGCLMIHIMIWMYLSLNKLKKSDYL